MIDSNACSHSLVTTDWVADHIDADDVRVVEVDVESEAYERSHLPGAIAWSWRRDLSDPLRRDIIDRAAFVSLMERSGVRPDDALVFYGDANNWFAAWGFWLAYQHGHRRVALMDGGRRQWVAERRPMTSAVPTPEPSRYAPGSPRPGHRALLAGVAAHARDGSADLIDVRSPAEYAGTILAPPGVPETCQRGGHIPGAVNVPWLTLCRPDGRYRSPDEIRAIYEAVGVTGERPIVAYCRIGERSAHSWFALHCILGYRDVANYDGSWTEWGNLVGMPIERAEL